jgi:hypothetical protein
VLSFLMMFAPVPGNNARLHVGQPHGVAHTSGAANARCGSRRLSRDKFPRLHAGTCQNMLMDAPHRALRGAHCSFFAELAAMRGRQLCL